LTWKVLKKIPTVVTVGGAVLSGVWWIANRRNVIARMNKKQKMRREQLKQAELEAEARAKEVKD
jgi:hypothetical protein